MIKDKLRELGFSEKEATIYLALLAVGSAVASDIAKRAGLKRSTAYVILEALAAKGLVSAVDRRGVRLYHAAPAEQLVQYMKSMASRYEGFADTAKKLIPELKLPRVPHTAVPHVRIVQGADGIRSVYEETLASLEDIRVHAHFSAAAEGAKGSADKNKRSVAIQKVFLDKPEDRRRVAPDTEGLRRVLLASREQAGAPSEMNIYDDRVVFISPSDNFALIAESHEFASALKKMCDAPSALAPAREKEPAHSRKAKSAPRILPGDFGLAFG